MSNYMAEKVPCDECGGEMARGTRKMTITYQGLESPQFEMPGYYCPSCEEGFVTGTDMKMSDYQLNLLKARAQNLMLPEEIKKARRKLGLTQREAGAILGGGPSAFGEYEKARRLPSQAICSVLRVLDMNPDALELLRRVYLVHERERTVPPPIRVYKPSERKTYAPTHNNERSAIV